MPKPELHSCSKSIRSPDHPCSAFMPKPYFRCQRGSEGALGKSSVVGPRASGSGSASGAIQMPASFALLNRPRPGLVQFKGLGAYGLRFRVWGFRGLGFRANGHRA